MGRGGAPRNKYLIYCGLKIIGGLQTQLYNCHKIMGGLEPPEPPPPPPPPPFLHLCYLVTLGAKIAGSTFDLGVLPGCPQVLLS